MCSFLQGILSLQQHRLLTFNSHLFKPAWYVTETTNTVNSIIFNLDSLSNLLAEMCTHCTG